MKLFVLQIYLKMHFRFILCLLVFLSIHFDTVFGYWNMFVWYLLISIHEWNLLKHLSSNDPLKWKHYHPSLTNTILMIALSRWGCRLTVEKISTIWNNLPNKLNFLSLCIHSMSTKRTAHRITLPRTKLNNFVIVTRHLSQSFIIIINVWII